MADRVDKSWQSQGLSKFSTQAILGTLSHYGVAVDEAGLSAQVQEKFPLELAQAWMAGWKGTGQFSKFPIAAADELWKRNAGDRLAPAEFAKTLVEGIQALDKKLSNGASAAEAASQAMGRVNALRPRVPLQDGKVDARFVAELSMRLGEAIQVFSRLAQELAKAGHVEDAAAFADLEAFLFPQWAGISQALVRAAKGEREPAISELAAIGKDASREPVSRVGAVDALLYLDAFQPAREIAEAVLDGAEKSEDFHLAMEVGERLAFALDKLQDRPALAALDQRMRKVHEGHAHAHPHHHH